MVLQNCTDLFFLDVQFRSASMGLYGSASHHPVVRRNSVQHMRYSFQVLAQTPLHAKAFAPPLDCLEGCFGEEALILACCQTSRRHLRKHSRHVLMSRGICAVCLHAECAFAMLQKQRVAGQLAAEGQGLPYLLVVGLVSYVSN